MPNLCAGCLAELPFLKTPFCPSCAQPVAHGTVCGACLIRPPPYERTCAALAYEGLAASLLQRLKFQGDLLAGAALGMLLGRAAAHAPRPDAVVPVPSSRRRCRERGYEVATELARGVRRELDLPLLQSAVTRPVHRDPQSSLTDWARRRANVRRVFHVKPARVRGRHLAIVDDVMTSGATVEALAAALLGAGASRVQVWVACRAGRDASPESGVQIRH